MATPGPPPTPKPRTKLNIPLTDDLAPGTDGAISPSTKPHYVNTHERNPSSSSTSSSSNSNPHYVNVYDRVPSSSVPTSEMTPPPTHRGTPPPRPPPPRIDRPPSATPSPLTTTEHQPAVSPVPPPPPPPSTNTTSLMMESSIRLGVFVENSGYLAPAALGISVSNGHSPTLPTASSRPTPSPKTRPAPPPPPPPSDYPKECPPEAPKFGWNLPAFAPPLPPRPLPATPSAAPVPSPECTPSTSSPSPSSKASTNGSYFDLSRGGSAGPSGDAFKNSKGNGHAKKESDASSDGIIELADSFDTVILDDSSMAIDGLCISYMGNVVLQMEKKKKKVHCRLRNSTLAFYQDDETEVSSPLVGPYNLADVVYLTYIGHNISIYFAGESDAFLVRFTPEEQFAEWIIMLGESLLSEVDLLRASLRMWSSIGKAWTRRGTTSEWKACTLAMHEHTLYSLEADDSLFVTDLRRVHSLKAKLDKVDWCLDAKKPEKTGPFLLSLEGSSLAVESDYATCTKEWREAVESVLRRPQTELSNCRLTASGVPVAVDKCISFIAAHGMHTEGVYRRNGNKAKERALLKQLVDDPHSAHLSFDSDDCVYVVADVLRQFFRGLASPLVPEDRQDEMFAILKEPDASVRSSRLMYLLESLPDVNYASIRRVISHLREVNQEAATNLASVENLAKVFGPTFFCVDASNSEEMHKQMGSQIQAVITLIQEFSLIFQETAREAASRCVLEEAKKRDATKKATATGMLVAVHLFEKDNRPFNVNVDLAADEVLVQAFALRDVERDPSKEYAVFEVLAGEHLTRRLGGDERLSGVVLDRWIRWKAASDAYLKVAPDPHPYSKNSMSPITGKVKVALEGSRWLQATEMKIEGDRSVQMCHLKNGKVIREWALDDIYIYQGTTRKINMGHYSFALTIIPKSFTGVFDKHTGITIYFKTIDGRTRFHNSILMQQESRSNVLVHI